jgi:hypothetical protein
MKSILLIAAILVIWFAINRYILPKLGIQT